MQVRKGFMSGFIVLGFAIFIAGFLTGMLAFAVMRQPTDATAMGLMFLGLGFIAGIVIFTIAVVAWRLRHRGGASQESAS